jgi:hypothetical protein
MKKLLLCATAVVAITLSSPVKAETFNGAYLGLQLGNNNTQSDMQWTNIDGSGIDIGTDNGASGLEFGAVAGYRMKQDRFVFGVEMNGDLSNAKGTILSYDDGVDAYSLEVEKNHSYAIGPRLGYVLTGHVENLKPLIH